MDTCRTYDVSTFLLTAESLYVYNFIDSKVWNWSRIIINVIVIVTIIYYNYNYINIINSRTNLMINENWSLALTINWLRDKIADTVDLFLEAHANDGKDDEDRSGQTSRRGLVAKNVYLDQVRQNDIQRSSDRDLTRALDFQRFRH